jgi:hypothetical protein
MHFADRLLIATAAAGMHGGERAFRRKRSREAASPYD